MSVRQLQRWRASIHSFMFHGVRSPNVFPRSYENKCPPCFVVPSTSLHISPPSHPHLTLLKITYGVEHRHLSGHCLSVVRPLSGGFSPFHGRRTGGRQPVISRYIVEDFSDIFTLADGRWWWLYNLLNLLQMILGDVFTCFFFVAVLTESRASIKVWKAIILPVSLWD